MPLQLHPMEESDLYAYHTIFYEAFKDGLMVMMYPNGYSEVDKEVGMKFQLQEWRKYPERLKMMKVIDTKLPEDGPTKNIVGVSKWKVYPKDRTQEDLDEEKRMFEEREWAPGANVEFFKEFVEMIGKCKSEVVGDKAHVLLGVLATLPSYHRRGVGAMHLKYGLDIADSLSIQSYVESSPMGRPLYERFGFAEVIPFPLDAKAWGLDHDLPHSCMIRPARTANGVAH